MIEISKELLEEILKVKVLKHKLNPKLLRYDYFESGVEYTSFSINIYELAHKCKVWALRQGYYLHSHTKEYNDCWCIVKSLDNITQQFSCKMDTEVEAIFKACEWILKEIKK